eukprot:6798420-Pyramimonas_sp.AAC.1
MPPDSAAGAPAGVNARTPAGADDAAEKLTSSLRAVGQRRMARAFGRPHRLNMSDRGRRVPRPLALVQTGQRCGSVVERGGICILFPGAGCARQGLSLIHI